MDNKLYFDKNKRSYDKLSVETLGIEVVAEAEISNLPPEFNGEESGTTWDIIDNKFVNFKTDINYQAKYNSYINSKDAQRRIDEIKEKLVDLDSKKIRALSEGGTMDNGMTYLEYYNNKAKLYRKQIASLEEKING